MKILHVISGIDLTGGGPSKSVCDLALNQALRGEKVTIFTQASPNPFLRESPNLNLQIIFSESSKFKLELKKLIKAENFDILHGHGIWQMAVHHMASMAREQDIPYLISPRGMLEPWALNVRKWKKKLGLVLFQKKDLEKSFCIHATAKMEAENILKLGFINPISVIPNGIDLSEFPFHARKEEKEKYILLFLSRIHPKKGIELLIEAWQKLDKNLRLSWQIEIAGTGEEKYVSSLERLIVDKGLSNQILIVGPQYGEAKLAFYNRADLFVLPTYSENFGIVVAEALSCGIPVITTKGTPWEELNTMNAGWWIDIGADPLAKALTNAMNLSELERFQMGKNGRQLVINNYSIESVAQKMIILYEFILKGGEESEFVI